MQGLQLNQKYMHHKDYMSTQLHKVNTIAFSWGINQQDDEA